MAFRRWNRPISTSLKPSISLEFNIPVYPPASTIELLSRLMLSVAVSLSILQTPIPVAHVHAGIGSEGVLSEHLIRHHQVEPVLGNEVHWHLMLPGQSGEDGDSGSNDPPVPPALVATGSSSIALHLGSSQIDRISIRQTDPCLGCLGRRVDSSRSLASPHWSLSSTERTCALLCVIRC